MGAPGLASEIWDPSRKCRQINLGSSDFETALDSRGYKAVPFTKT
jgi:hypothetical protein